MTIVMDWEQVPAMRVSQINKLPADTELMFRDGEGEDHEGHGEDMDHGDMNH